MKFDLDAGMLSSPPALDHPRSLHTPNQTTAS